MTKRSLPKLLAASALCLTVTTTSCIGPNNAYNSLASWNSTVTENKVVNELLFLGLNIVPAYPVFLFGDYIVFNSWEWWTGENLIKPAKEFKSQSDL